MKADFQSYELGGLSAQMLYLYIYRSYPDAFLLKTLLKPEKFI